MLRYWLWLSTRNYLSFRDKMRMLEHFGTPESAYLSDEYEYRHIETLPEKAIVSLLDKDLKAVEKILRDCDNKRIAILTWQDAAYPARLKNIASPPLVLYYEGRLPHVDEEVTIGMVGTRKASGYGLKNAKEIGYQLGRGGAIVVSGLAEGIDAASLEGALTSGKPVIAVLGNGTDVIYPAKNRSLYRDVKNNGCLISEYPPGTRGLKENFPTRNRIISGLSLGVVVVEAPRRSGALITADRALEQGRDVFTIPGNLGVSTLEGNLQLLKEGAYLIENGSDVLREYVGRFSTVTDQRIPGNFSAAEPAVVETAACSGDKKSVDNGKNTNYIDLEDAISDASPEGAAILRMLENGAAHVDDIIESTQIPASKVLSAITILEIRRHIKRLPGRRFSLAEKE